MKVGASLFAIAMVVTSCTSVPSNAAIGSTPVPTSSASAATTTATTRIATVAPASATSAPTTAATLVWPAGTITCATIEGNYPNGADDHNLLLDKGVLSFHRQPQGGEEWIQFVDDPTCLAESAAWQFMISNVIDAESLYRQGLLCDFYERLTLAEPEALNARTVIDHLSAAQDLCAKS